jgi:hypothetical protein
MSNDDNIAKKWKEELVKISRDSIRILDTMILPENPAIVFDIDETLIDLLTNPIQPICVIYHYARLLGISVMIVTARNNVPLHIDMVKVHLARIGITEVEKWYFRDHLDHQYASYKEQARCDITNNGYNIVMSVGDRDWDITGQYVGVGVKIPSFASILAEQILSDTIQEEIENKLFDTLFDQLSFSCALEDNIVLSNEIF